jgi:hypothetical protein
MMEWLMIVLACLGSQSTKFHSAGWTCWFFMSFYLALCIWPDVISWWIRQRNRGCVMFCANHRKSVTETMAMIRQLFEEASMSRTWKVQNCWDQKIWDRWRTKSRACTYFFFFFTSRGLLTKNLSWQAKQSTLYITMTFYSGYMKMYKDFTANFGDKKLAVASRQYTISHFLFHLGIFDPKQHDCHPPPTLLFCFLNKLHGLSPRANYTDWATALFPQSRIKLKGRHFNTMKVINSELQVVMNTLT